MWTLWHTTASRQRCARPMLGERKGKKGSKKRERAHGRPNISSSKSGKGRVGLSWESSGRRSAAAHRGRAKLTGLKKTHWMSTWTNVYVFFSSFFFSKQLNCTDLKHLFHLIKKQAYSDLQKIAWVLLVLTRLPWMQIHPDWMEFSQWKTFFYCDFWLTR